MRMSPLTCLLAAGLLALLSLPGGAAAQSFDCGKAREADEIAICNDCALAQLDVKLATLYEVATSLVAMGQRGEIQGDQRNWLKARHSCGSDTGCIERDYNERIAELQRVLKNIYANGPY